MIAAACFDRIRLFYAMECGSFVDGRRRYTYVLVQIQNLRPIVECGAILRTVDVRGSIFLCLEQHFFVAICFVVKGKAVPDYSCSASARWLQLSLGARLFAPRDALTNKTEHPKPALKTHVQYSRNPRYIPRVHASTRTQRFGASGLAKLGTCLTDIVRRRILSISTMPNNKLAELSREASGGKLAALRELLRFLRKDKVGFSILSHRPLLVVQQYSYWLRIGYWLQPVASVGGTSRCCKRVDAVTSFSYAPLGVFRHFPWCRCCRAVVVVAVRPDDAAMWCSLPALLFRKGLSESTRTAAQQQQQQQ